MIQRVLWVGLLAGLVAGLATAALQHFTTTPMILAAEVYEDAGPAVAPAGNHAHADAHAAAPAGVAGPDHGAVAHDHEAGGWQPADGAERIAFTSLATVITAIGFALMLTAAMLVGGGAITVHSGVAWAAAAFVVTGLAPGLGLAPELPGSGAGELVARQLWWAGTAAATAGGLWLLLRVPAAWANAAGLVLLALPHLIGAPHPAAFESRVPAELAAHFSATSLVLHAILWGLVGAAVGFFWSRDGRRSMRASLA